MARRKVTRGRLDGIPDDMRGWLIGHFYPKASPLHTENIEFKCDHAKAGERRIREQMAKHETMHSLQFVISGRVKTSFPGAIEAEDTHEVVGPGEWCLWEKGQLHYWEVLEDGLILTLRWKP